MTDRLKNSIERLYNTFQKYPSGPTMVGSPHYEDLADWNRSLFQKPLRELTSDDLSRFTGKAITTWGNSEDYKHFLPRIFELVAELSAPYSIEIAFGKLSLAKWEDWEGEEQGQVHEFMISLWDNLVNDSSPKAEWEFKEYFAVIGQYYPRFRDLLDIWAQAESKAAIQHLAKFLIEDKTAIFDKKKISGFQDQTENIEPFISWILSDTMLNKVQQKYFEFEAEPFAQEVSWAEQIITNERKRIVP
ncbi:MAG: hypothetical protein AAFQ98_19800 [Bacteroidota bacterium]